MRIDEDDFFKVFIHKQMKNFQEQVKNNSQSTLENSKSNIKAKCIYSGKKKTNY